MNRIAYRRVPIRIGSEEIFRITYYVIFIKATSYFYYLSHKSKDSPKTLALGGGKWDTLLDSNLESSDIILD